MRNLVLTGGGTAGHCTPCLSLLPLLEKRFDNVYYIGSENGIEREMVKNAGVEYFSVPAIKLKRSLSLSNLTIPFILTSGISAAKKLLKKLNASVVFSKGGYVALPVAIAAGKLGVPLVLHESDLTLGLANKISARYACEVLTSFRETAENLKNGLFTGAPVNPALLSAPRAEGRRRYGITGLKPVLLVFGGSSGSVAINRVLRGVLPALTEKFNVLHLTGKNGYDENAKDVKGYFQIPFEPEMKYAYAAADVAVSRAGSNSLFELAALKIPALLIPLPKGASRGDQIDNARYFASRGAFRILLQEDITGEKFTEEIIKTYESRLNLTLSQQKFQKNANETIAERIVRASLKTSR
ncbi:MAG: UDP-N-acetylglucosamine--N-acetylmuramyl-(pentapeptide) pyrophosphoryl-undecaprenol N-acetylglucosamine transferase [Clostridia bacterium]|nr:UDP-N-acetylglucosamine--N-acetylmuramyl-(pentapeptide) pyrophosphoryl-undecaprenol N-acetylglucosamine transferase [Clostridia bacterium]